MPKRVIVAYGILCASILVLAACGDGDSGPQLQPPVADISGKWSITEKSDETKCGGGIVTTKYTVTVTQSDNILIVTTPAGKFNGTISGNTISWTGSFPEDGGTTTIDSMTLTVSSTGKSISGTSSWTWTNGNGTFTCSGTSQISGTKTAKASSAIKEQEPNDLLSQAQVLSAPVTVNGTTSGSASTNSSPDYDHYSYIPPTTGSVTITLSNYGSADLNLFVYDANINIIGSSHSNNDPIETVTVTLIEGAQYYIQIEPWITSDSTTYELMLE